MFYASFNARCECGIQKNRVSHREVNAFIPNGNNFMQFFCNFVKNSCSDSTFHKKCGKGWKNLIRQEPVETYNVMPIIMKSAFKGSLSAALLAACLLCSCGNKENSSADRLPANFDSLGDAAKVAYMMKMVSPDSVARFICDAALRKNKGETIDTLAIAVAYAYENFNDSSLIVFSREFEDYSENLPLSDKMKIYMMAGQTDFKRLGYELGLEYVNHIRESRMSVEDIKREIEEFRKACADDSATYKRFVKGFKTVLKVDHGKDLSEDVYKAFSEIN